jgi:hypothetical protein
MDFTCFASPCTGVLGLKVYSGCKVSKIMMEIFDVAMGKILQSDILNVDVGGVGCVNVSFPDEVGEVFLVLPPPVLCFGFWLGWHWGGRAGSRLCVL